jgi:hypothetical protein
MNLSMTRLITVSAFVVALGWGASQARAQKATFHLPFEAHWGSTVLDPGNYTLSAPNSSSPTRIFFLHGNAGIQMAVPIIVNNETASGHSHLKLVKVDGTYYVQEYVSEATGTSLKFATPRATHRELRAQDQVLLALDF